MGPNLFRCDFSLCLKILSIWMHAWLPVEWRLSIYGFLLCGKFYRIVQVLVEPLSIMLSIVACFLLVVVTPCGYCVCIESGETAECSGLGWTTPIINSSANPVITRLKIRGDWWTPSEAVLHRLYPHLAVSCLLAFCCSTLSIITILAEVQFHILFIFRIP